MIIIERGASSVVPTNNRPQHEPEKASPGTLARLPEKMAFARRALARVVGGHELLEQGFLVTIKDSWVAGVGVNA